MSDLAWFIYRKPVIIDAEISVNFWPQQINLPNSKCITCLIDWTELDSGRGRAVANEICFLYICMHAACVCESVGSNGVESTRCHFWHFGWHFSAAQQMMQAPTVCPLPFLSLLISLCVPHARCTKCELSLLYIFSFACQAHLRHGAAAGRALGSTGLGWAVIRMTTKKKWQKRNTNYGKWAQILMKFNNEKQIK